MDFTQNEKIEQIKFETLVVGVEIGKETNYARALDYRVESLRRYLNLVILEKAFRPSTNGSTKSQG